MCRGAEISTAPFILNPAGNTACGDFILGMGGRNQKAVLMGVQRQNAFSGKPHHATPKNAPTPQKTPVKPKKAPTPRYHHTHAPAIHTTPGGYSITRPAPSPSPTLHSQHLPSLAPASLPLNKMGVDRPKSGCKPYKTPQNRRIHELSKTIQNSPKPPKISSSPVFI